MKQKRRRVPCRVGIEAQNHIHRLFLKGTERTLGVLLQVKRRVALELFHGRPCPAHVRKPPEPHVTVRVGLPHQERTISVKYPVGLNAPRALPSSPLRKIVKFNHAAAFDSFAQDGEQTLFKTRPRAGAHRKSLRPHEHFQIRFAFPGRARPCDGVQLAAKVPKRHRVLRKAGSFQPRDGGFEFRQLLG